MPIRHNREPQSPGPAPRGSHARSHGGEQRRAWRKWTTLLLLAALALAAIQAPIAQARGAHERSPEEEAAAVTSRETAQAERAEHAAARKAELAAERSAARAEQQAAQNGERSLQNGTRPREHGSVEFSCEQVNWTFTQFHAGSNTVKHVVAVTNLETGETVKFRGSTAFAGEEGKTVTPLNLPPGSYKVDAWAKWKGNGLKGSFDILGRLTCGPAPAFSIEKLQRIGTGAFTKSTLLGEVGETVEYEIVLENTGNVPLSFETLVEDNCDEGTLSGGPGASPLLPGASTTYTCTHVLNAGDRAAGSHSNSARSTGAPPEGDGPPITHTSNTVIVTVANPAPAFTLEKLQTIAGSADPFTTSTLNGQVGQTVDYEVLVENTGNVSLTLSGFTDAQCDPSTIAGGPLGGVLAAGASATYTCSHLLSDVDLAVGSYSNTAGLTGAPPESGGEPITHTSNTVVVTVSPTPPSGGVSSSTPSGGVLSSSVSQPPVSSVLASALSSIPRLTVPQGCVRNRFQVSVKSAGVHSVTFYLDGHKLKTLTSRNAHKGLLSIQIDPARWKVGPHRLVAKISMTAPGAGKARTASRTARLVRCRAAVLTPKFTG
jgi:uncharacterized repeat protein (TIGR01451 family)